MDLHIEDDLIGPELQITKCIFKNPLFCNKNFEVLLYHYIENEKLNWKTFGFTLSYKLILETYFWVVENLFNYCS